MIENDNSALFHQNIEVSNLCEPFIINHLKS